LVLVLLDRRTLRPQPVLCHRRCQHGVGRWHRADTWRLSWLAQVTPPTLIGRAY